MTLDEVCDKAAQFQLAGRPELAVQLYEAVLQSKPTHAAANHGVGMLKVHSRHPADGLPYLLAAVRGQPRLQDYWMDYLEALLTTGLAREAGETLALGRQHGLAGAAVEDFSKRLAVAMPPTLTAVQTTPRAARRAAAVRAAARRALCRLEAAMLAQLKLGYFDQALGVARTLTERFPDQGLGWKTLGFLLWRDGRNKDALVPMQTAARLLPRDPEVYSNLGQVLVNLKGIDAAEPCLLHALELDPSDATARHALGSVYFLQDRFSEAQRSIIAFTTLRPDGSSADDFRARSDLLLLLSHDPAMSADALFAAHCRFGEHFETPLRALWPRLANHPDPDRCLRVGFVSGDFRNHSVARYIEPVFERLAQFADLELHAYSNNSAGDAVTQRLRGHVQYWHPVASLSDSELAEMITRDGIDILIDLSGHTASNRLYTFARKPAPIQASWCGYPGTTGLRSVDYYLVDRQFLPPGQLDRHFSEKLVYLPALTPFLPEPSAPPVNALPALATGSLTFGSFARLGKVNSTTLGMWAQLLLALPESKLVVGAVTPVGGASKRLIEQLAALGVVRERLILHPRCGLDVYLSLHHHVDICLDTYPFTGLTTSNHALWMGVPVLTVAGQTPPARQGAWIMGQLGLEGFVATDAADFLQKGVYWSNHLAELATVRATLRSRWLQTPGRNPELIATGFAAALRHMWKRWCAGLPAESFEIHDLSQTAPIQ